MPSRGLRTEIETIDVMRAEALALLLQCSVRFGDFTLASGKKSDLYIDGRQTALNFRGTYLLGHLLYFAVVDIESKFGNVQGVGGMTLGADPLTTATVFAAHQRKTPLHGFIVRKETKKHGAAQQVEGLFNLPPKSRVVLLEDIVTTGASSLKAANACTAAGLEVLAVLAVVDRQEGARDAIEAKNFPFFSLYERSDFETKAE